MINIANSANQPKCLFVSPTRRPFSVKFVKTWVSLTRCVRLIMCATPRAKYAAPMSCAASAVSRAATSTMSVFAHWAADKRTRSFLP